MLHKFIFAFFILGVSYSSISFSKDPCDLEDLAKIYEIFEERILIASVKRDMNKKNNDRTKYADKLKMLKGLSSGSIKHFLDSLYKLDSSALRSFITVMNTNSSGGLSRGSEGISIHGRNSIIFGEIEKYYFGENSWSDVTKYLVEEFQIKSSDKDPRIASSAKETLDLFIEARDRPFEHLDNLIATAQAP